METLALFYRYANKKLYTKSSVSPLLVATVHTHTLHGNPTEKAESLQEAFTKTNFLGTGVLHRRDCSKMSNCQLTRVSYINRRSPCHRKTAAWNQRWSGWLPASFFTDCRKELSYHFSQFFALSLKHSILYPLHGSPDLLLNSSKRTNQLTLITIVPSPSCALCVNYWNASLKIGFWIFWLAKDSSLSINMFSLSNTQHWKVCCSPRKAGSLDSLPISAPM